MKTLTTRKKAEKPEMKTMKEIVRQTMRKLKKAETNTMKNLMVCMRVLA